MIVITDIKYHQVADDAKIDPKNIHDLPDLVTTQWLSQPDEKPSLEQIDVVRGFEFKNPMSNELIMIGNTNFVADLIGIQFETFENMSKSYEYLNYNYNTVSKQNRTLNKFVDAASNASFLTRLRWLFTGCNL